MRKCFRYGKIYQVALGLGLFFISLTITKATFGSDKSNGCGIGWYFSKDKTILASSMRSSSNSTSPNSISMTSGTSGCAEHDIVEQNKKTEHFVEANFDALRQDIAVGSGEYLTTLSATLGCRWYTLQTLSAATRRHYDYLFHKQAPAQAVHAVGKLRHILASYPELQQNCGGV